MRALSAVLLASLGLAACNNNQPPPKQREIRIVSEEQKQLHQFDAFNLAIALKRAIYDAGYTCKRVTDAGYVGIWQNLDMWMARCDYGAGSTRDWAVFAGPDGSAQVRACTDITPGSGLPSCDIKQRPAGKFSDLQ